MAVSGKVTIPVSCGELIDKITILEVKSENIKDQVKKQNIVRELAMLKELWQSLPHKSGDIETWTSQLRTVNRVLWDIEDEIRLKESRNEFDNGFIELARSVYINNDERAAIKYKINSALGSDIVEEKFYSDYAAKD